MWHIPDAVCLVLYSWWWTERPSATCRVIFNNSKNCASSWFYYRNISQRTVPWTSLLPHFFLSAASISANSSTVLTYLCMVGCLSTWVCLQVCHPWPGVNDGWESEKLLSVKCFSATWDPSDSLVRGGWWQFFSMGHSSDPGLTPCWGHYYIYLKENLPSTHAGEKAMKQKKKTVVFITYINWAFVKEGTIYCPVHGHLQVNYRRTTQTRIGQVIANRQTLENKSVLKEMGWLRLPELLAGEGSSGAEWYVILPWMGWWLCCVEWTSRAGRLRNRVSIPGVAKYLSVNFIFMDPCIVDDSVEIPTKCSFVIEFIIPKFFFEGSTCFKRHTAHHQEL